METLWCGRTLAEVEREHILGTLARCHGNRTRAASLLRISVRGLRIKLHEYAQAGCVVCKPHTHPECADCDRMKSLSASDRGH